MHSFDHCHYSWLRLKSFEIWRNFWRGLGLQIPPIVWVGATLEGGAVFNVPIYLSTSHDFFEYTKKFRAHLYFQAQGSEVVSENVFVGEWSQISVDVVHSSQLHINATPTSDLWRCVDFEDCAGGALKW